jgi:excisionase family DNA binding protein
MTPKGNGQRAAINNESDLYEVLSTCDVARIMKCGVRKVQRMAALGQLPMKLFGSEYIITRKKLQEYLDE